jgi:Mce-associated membrane protein
VSTTGKTRDSSVNGVGPSAQEAEPVPVLRPRLSWPSWLSWVRRPLVFVVVFAVAGAGLQVLTWQVRHDPAAGNRALVDTETTDGVIGEVGNGLSRILSYSPDTTDSTAQAAQEVLGGNASSEYNALFSQVKLRAATEGLTLTTRVVRAGVIRLSGGTAQLLVFLDQIIVRKDKPNGTTVAAQLSVTARFDAGHWRIVEIHAR